MTSIEIILKVVGAVFIFMNLVLLRAVAIKKNDIVDFAWGIGFVLIINVYMSFSPVVSARTLLMSVLVLIWGLRLAFYIHMRNRGKSEDFRYANWRREWGRHWILRSYLQVFLLQGFFMLTVAYPLFIFDAESSPAIGWLDQLGAIIWLIGFFFEAVGDYQMHRFKKNPANKGKIMNKGLWKYTRHPNYFGEATMWWGIFIIALSNPHGWVAVFSPIIMTFLLVRVSGVPMLEKKYADNPEYREYIRRTSAFFPLLPKQ